MSLKNMTTEILAFKKKLKAELEYQFNNTRDLCIVWYWPW